MRGSFSAGYPCHKATSLPAALLTSGLAPRSRACRAGTSSGTIFWKSPWSSQTYSARVCCSRKWVANCDFAIVLSQNHPQQQAEFRAFWWGACFQTLSICTGRPGDHVDSCYPEERSPQNVFSIDRCTEISPIARRESAANEAPALPSTWGTGGVRPA